MVRERKKWIVLAIFILVVSGLVFIYGRKGTDQTKPVTNDAKLVETETVKLDHVSRHLELSGTLLPGAEADISFETSGLITEMYYEEGDQVAVGTIMARVDATEYSLQLAQFETAMEKSRVTYQKARDDFNSMEKLYRHGALSENDYEIARDRLTVAEEEYLLVQKSYTLVNEGKNQLRAPATGTVLAKLSSTGQIVDTGTPIYRIGQVNQLKAILPVPDSEISSWKKGDAVTMILHNVSREGRVTRILPTTNRGTGAIGVEVTVDNSKRDWFPGQVVRVRRVGETIEGIFVPVQAVLSYGEEKPYIFVVSGDKVVKTTVNTGQLIDDRLEIVSGLKPGNLVVVRGAEQLFDGSPIKQVGVGQ